MAEGNVIPLRSIPIPDDVEILHCVEVGFGRHNPDLAMLRVQSSQDGEPIDRWFALSRELLCEIGMRLFANATGANEKAKN